jgi:hypothetical protein
VGFSAHEGTPFLIPARYNPSMAEAQGSLDRYEWGLNWRSAFSDDDDDLLLRICVQHLFRILCDFALLFLVPFIRFSSSFQGFLCYDRISESPPFS